MFHLDLGLAEWTPRMASYTGAQNQKNKFQ